MDWRRVSSSRHFAPVVEGSIEYVKKAQVPRVEEWITALRSRNFYAFVAI